MTNRERELNGDMENRIPSETRGSPHTFKSVINKERLLLYEEAGRKTRYKVKVTGQEGAWVEYPDHRSKPNNSGLVRTQISPGYVEVAVTVPPGREKVGTAPFFDAIEELEQSPK